MVVRNENEALCVAIEMERRAIRMYERALMIVKDAEVAAGIQKILADEKEHRLQQQTADQDDQGDIARTAHHLCVHIFEQVSVHLQSTA